MIHRGVLRYPTDRLVVALVFAACAVNILPFTVRLPLWGLVACWFAVIYLRTFAAFIQHNHAHLKTFYSPSLNRLFEVPLMLLSGYVTGIWELHHNRGHHRHYLSPEQDVASIFLPDTRTPMSRWRYSLFGNLKVHRDSFRIGWKEYRDNGSWLIFQFVFEVALQLAVFTALLFWKPILAIVFVIVPSIVCAWMIFWESYSHHVDLPLTGPNDSAMSVEEPTYNRFTFNIGHHAAHHQKPTLHWSLLPTHTAKIRSQLHPACIRQNHSTAGLRWKPKSSNTNVRATTKAPPYRSIGIATVATLAFLAATNSWAMAQEWIQSPEARTADFQEEKGLIVSMLGDSTVRDFHIASGPEMLFEQWTKYRNDPFVSTDPALAIDSIFERLAKLTPVQAFQYSRSGASVGPARTWFRRTFQWMANVKTLEEEIDELLSKPGFPDLVLVWAGHNNMDFVTQRTQFSAKGDLDEAIQGIEEVFEATLKADLARLIKRAQNDGRTHAIVVYGLVNPIGTRRARDLARAMQAQQPGLYPYLATTEERFPPLRPEYGDRLEQLSLNLSKRMSKVVALLQPSVTGTHLRLDYSDATVVMNFSHPEDLSAEDAWHASTQGKRIIAQALYQGLEPSLKFLGVHQ